jgi:hypothetical protein
VEGDISLPGTAAKEYFQGRSRLAPEKDKALDWKMADTIESPLLSDLSAVTYAIAELTSALARMQSGDVRPARGRNLACNRASQSAAKGCARAKNEKFMIRLLEHEFQPSKNCVDMK